MESIVYSLSAIIVANRIEIPKIVIAFVAPDHDSAIQFAKHVIKSDLEDDHSDFTAFLDTINKNNMYFKHFLLHMNREPDEGLWEVASIEIAMQPCPHLKINILD